jgi:hypothetical protein
MRPVGVGMRPSILLLFPILLAALLPAACVDPAAAADAPPPSPYERTCRAATECPGRKCVELSSNAQGLSGVCSARCTEDADCGSGAACFLFGEAGPSCLALCDGAQACGGGLTCTAIGTDGARACFVTAKPVPGA